MSEDKQFLFTSAACVTVMVITIYVLRSRYLEGLKQIHETEYRNRILKSDGVRMCSGMYFRCDVCQNQIHENRYVCWDCDENQETFDLCEKCRSIHPPEHRVRKCKHALIEIEESKCSAERLISIFEQYEERKCFGKRLSLDQKPYENEVANSLGDFEWISYGEVGTRAKSISAYLQSNRLKLNLADKSYIGICGKNSVDWYCSDYAICLMGRFLFYRIFPSSSPLLSSEERPIIYKYIRTYFFVQ